MTPSQLQILQHSLGMDRRHEGPQYRNYFVASEGHSDYPDLLELVAAGFMTRRAGNALSGGYDVFNVTDAGKAAMTKHSPPPPKTTRSQRRYRAFLRADSGLKFGTWLRTSWAKEVQ